MSGLKSSCLVALVFAFLIVNVQSMYTGQGANTVPKNAYASSPFGMMMQRRMMQNVYNRPQRVQQNPFNIPPWMFLMDGFDFGL